jgi:hypothetical protein
MDPTYPPRDTDGTACPDSWKRGGESSPFGNSHDARLSALLRNDSSATQRLYRFKSPIW